MNRCCALCVLRERGLRAQRTPPPPRPPNCRGLKSKREAGAQQASKASSAAHREAVASTPACVRMCSTMRAHVAVSASTLPLGLARRRCSTGDTSQSLPPYSARPAASHRIAPQASTNQNQQALAHRRKPATLISRCTRMRLCSTQRCLQPERSQARALHAHSPKRSAHVIRVCGQRIRSAYLAPLPGPAAARRPWSAAWAVPRGRRARPGA